VLFDDGAVKLADFGLSTRLSGRPLYGPTGTLVYTAPEVHQGKYNEKVDLYALGFMAHQMCTGQMPFDDDDGKHLDAQI